MEITSSPYLIDPTNFGLDDHAKNRVKLAEYKRKYKSQVIGTYKNHPITEYAMSSDLSALIMENEDEIIYLLRVKQIRLPNLSSSAVTETMVWRRVGRPAGDLVSGLARHVVLKILLHQTKYVVSDQAHTEHGRRFWIDLLASAFDRGHRIGVFLDESEPDWCPNDSRHATQEWFDLAMNAWGTKNINFDTRFVIEAK